MLLFLSGESDVDGPGQGHARLASGYPPYSEDMAMRLSSRFFPDLAVAVSSFALLLFGLSGAAMAATDPSGSSSLPSITVQAPKQTAGPHRTVPRAVTRSTGRRHTASRGISPSSATPSGGHGQESVLERLHRIERETHSCDGGCATSLPSHGKPWIGCSVSGWPMYSGTCRNGRKYKNYVQCAEEGYFLAWKVMDVHWYCTSLAFKN
jgi:hypothetical protein